LAKSKTQKSGKNNKASHSEVRNTGADEAMGVDCSQPRGPKDSRWHNITAVAVLGVLINNCGFFGKDRKDHYFNPAAAQPIHTASGELFSASWNPGKEVSSSLVASSLMPVSTSSLPPSHNAGG
jgi:hypothetical protein